jgi:glycosyltransferase involved in cell wall biosynthesis
MYRITFINRFFYPDSSATSQLLTDLSTELVKQGLQVKIITSRQLHQKRSQPLPKKESHNGVQIHRVKTFNFAQFGIVGRALDYITFYILATFRLLITTHSTDILVAKTDPPLMSILVRLIGSLRQAKTINWLQDIFPEVAEQLGMAPKGHGIGTVIRGLRNWSLRNADANVVLGKQMHKRLLSFGVPDEKIQIIQNWADGNLITPISHNENPLRHKWGLTNKFVIAYSGNMGRAHEISTILETAESLQEHSDIVFLWIGGGVNYGKLKQEVQRRGLTNFVFKGYQDQDQLKLSLSVADIHFIILSSNLEGLIVPSKFYGVAAAGRPTIFIGDRRGDLVKLIQDAECGYSFNEGEGGEIAKLLIYLSMNPDIIETLGVNARIAFEKNYRLSYATTKWEKLCNNVQESTRANFLLRNSLRKS